MPNQPNGFEYTTAANGDVAITHHGRSAATLRGNERTAKNHPRNGGQRR